MHAHMQQQRIHKPMKRDATAHHIFEGEVSRARSALLIVVSLMLRLWIIQMANVTMDSMHRLHARSKEEISMACLSVQ